MSTAEQRWRSEIDQIESIADTKGVEIDDIEVIEGTTDDNDELITFRIYETKAESETDSVGVQVSKVPSMETGDMTFRDDVQNKISALKKHLNSSEDDEVEPELAENDDDTTNTQSSRTRNVSVDTDVGDGPGSMIDGQIAQHEARIEQLEDRVEELEEYIEALEGLQQLIGAHDG